MSLAKCFQCNTILDTDVNPECYEQRLPNDLEYQVKKLDYPICDNCNDDNYHQLKKLKWDIK